jgi:hypothetical protein
MTRPTYDDYMVCDLVEDVRRAERLWSVAREAAFKLGTPGAFADEVRTREEYIARVDTLRVILGFPSMVWMNWSWR